MSIATIGEYIAGNRVGQGYTTVQEVDFSAGEASSSAFAAATQVIRVCSDADCRFLIGVAPTADTNDQFLPASVVEYFEIKPGQSWAISLIAHA